MALTNAEWQAKYKKRLRAVLADIQKQDPAFTPYDAALEIVHGEYNWREVIAPLALELLGLPADPWPGLTYNALLTMVGKRTKDAKRKGLPISHPGRG
jgi:hypothetical protein